ncbi:MAG: dTDP-4-amino-4,6-dideoxygalactose transaminase [Bdellovibrionales bacterium]
MNRYRTRLNQPSLNRSASLTAIRRALEGPLNGNAELTWQCQSWLESHTGAAKAFLTPSCTAALEMAFLLAMLKPGDEVIMPSFTFSSTANAVVLRGGVPVFIDIRSDTLNLDEKLISSAITSRTKVICPVHYAAVGCEMDDILLLAKQHNLLVVEDAAQALGATYRGKALGSLGDFGAFSFHASKIVTSGEGGALLIKNKGNVQRGEILWEKGTNRVQLIQGKIEKYTWIDIGSSFLPSEITAALLLTQLQIAPKLIERRLKLWNFYHKGLSRLEEATLLRRPIIPNHCHHNGHIYYILLPNAKIRDRLRRHLAAKGIEACFHYVPLHSSPAGKRFARSASTMSVTNQAASTLLRLPLFPDMNYSDVSKILKHIFTFFGRRS